MAAKHTPGPWFAKRDRRRVTPWAIESATSHIADVQRCVIHGLESDAEAQANALLIAAAPLMREALLAVRAACRDPDTDTAMPSATGELVEAALAAMRERS